MSAPSQQMSQRRKLRPRKPRYGPVKQGTANVVYNLRDDRLTENQRSWARVLTASAWYGYRRGQRSYSDRVESGGQTGDGTESLSKPTESRWDPQQAAREAATRARHIHEQKATAWARKARLMHQAGSGNKQTKGWDPVEEVYSRDYEREAEVARLKAAMHAWYSRGVSDSSSDSDSEEDIDNTKPEVGNLENEISNTSAPPRIHRTQLIQPPTAPVLDWRTKARNSIAKKKLSITRGWSAVTWGQKSSIKERLLLLEDDGYDIQSLQDRKAASEEVTAIILERVAARHRPSITSGTSAQELHESTPQSGPFRGQSLELRDPALAQIAVSPAHSITHKRPFNQLRPREAHPSASSPQYTEPKEAPVIRDTTQPFSQNKSYVPQPSSRLKRKRSHDSDTEDRDDLQSVISPARKKRFSHATEDDLKLSALHEVKLKVLRHLFRSARSLTRKLSPPARVIFTPSMTASDSTPEQTSTHMLSYLYNNASALSPNHAPLRMPSKGLERLVDELHFLASAQEDNCDIVIHDPDYDTPPLTAPASAEAKINANLLAQRRQKSRVLVSHTEDGGAVFQGESGTLAELFKVLGGGKLLHLVSWEWDGGTLGEREGLDWVLGPGTQRVLSDVAGRLRGGERGLGPKIVVHVV